MRLLLILLLSARSFAQTALACTEPEPSQCDENSQACDLGTDRNGCWIGDFCQPNEYSCPPVCHAPMPAQCDANSQVCDMGWSGSCWMGDYCQPWDVPCPVACYTPMPSQCDANSTACDMGTDMFGCWMGDYCQ